jgi:LmbE family N-acetylglucosaminyl deacetylase
MMNLFQPEAQWFVPDGKPVDEALARTTHLCIAAHQDDIEIMAADGILKCYQQPDHWFAGVVVTDGRGSPRDALYGSYTDEEMRLVRIDEQKKAAFIGEFGSLALLDYTSKSVKDPAGMDLIEDLRSILLAAKPEVLYTHNLADKHPTHIAVALRTLAAVRSLPEEQRPGQVYGCEVWRDLDWMLDEDKVAFNLSEHENLQMALLGVFDSQIAGGKRYDLAGMGRRRANATFYASHGTDISTGMSFAMDLTPLVRDTSLDVESYVLGFIDRFRADAASQIKQFSGNKSWDRDELHER